MNVEGFMEDCRYEHDVAGQRPVERRHPIQDQGFLCLVQIELRREADAENDVSLNRMLFLCDDLVAVVLGDVGGEEDVLLKHSFVSEFCPHVVRERSRPGQQILHVLSEEDRQFFQSDQCDLFVQFFSGFPICFVQLLHPFYS